ncbi:hypothetical protein WDU94_003331 [Cyamophila willieti]
MVCLVLTVLLLSSIYTLKANESSKDFKMSLEQAILRGKQVQIVKLGQIKYDSLHRMRRKASEQDFFDRIPSNRLERDSYNSEQVSKEFAPSCNETAAWKRGKGTRNFSQIKGKRKPTFVCKWPEWRKELHGQFMQQYWKYHSDFNESRLEKMKELKKAFWENKSKYGACKKCTDSKEEIGTKLMKQMPKNKSVNTRLWSQERKKNFSELKKRYWMLKRNHQKLSKIMKEYWERNRQESGTWRQKVYSERMKKFWEQERKKGGGRLKENRASMKQFWKRYREEGRTNIQKKCRERMLAYWKRVKEEKGDELRELSEFRRRQRNERKKMNRTALRDKKEGTTKYVNLKQRMRDYWRRERDKEMRNLTRKIITMG